jgi:hypothetical protein
MSGRFIIFRVVADATTSGGWSGVDDKYLEYK